MTKQICVPEDRCGQGLQQPAGRKKELVGFKEKTKQKQVGDDRWVVHSWRARTRGYFPFASLPLPWLPSEAPSKDSGDGCSWLPFLISPQGLGQALPPGPVWQVSALQTVPAQHLQRGPQSPVAIEQAPEGLWAVCVKLRVWTCTSWSKFLFF